MSLQNPFAFHYQGVWLERSADTQLPDWLRLASLAFGRHKANGHANFGVGEIAKLLGKCEPDGKVKPLSGPAVSNAIKRAKDHGFIAIASHSRCLVVPPHAVTGGLGNAYERCRIHVQAVVTHGPHGISTSAGEVGRVLVHDEHELDSQSA
ncbi:hypothetical protein [Mycolicibacterium peregrinum]|uniref:hypothetical protein n=1 Tax=Mycolicibacterium peregrinum TaxID=43304 RepID=UPI000AC5204B|nr:hypothetical protein [Mycolicibacterium peregrinum]